MPAIAIEEFVNDGGHRRGRRLQTTRPGGGPRETCAPTARAIPRPSATRRALLEPVSAEFFRREGRCPEKACAATAT
jgi:hypothetical protein